MTEPNPTTRCGFVALIGAPNAGKSTLLNAMVGAKVSIVTHKVQTTRARIRGVAMRDATQIVLVDTPGIFKPKRRLDRAMVETAWGEFQGAEQTVLLIDVRKGVSDDVTRIIEEIKKDGRKVILALNKIDLIARDKLLAMTTELMDQGIFADVFMISALTGDGVEDLMAHLAGLMPEGPWMFPEDDLSDLPIRMLAAEITREKLYLRLHQELPYDSTVETESWQEKPDGSVRIDQVIYVTRDSQKPIVLGKKGQTIKEIGANARKELMDIVGGRVHLFLQVKVRGGWQNDPERYREMGLDWVPD